MSTKIIILILMGIGVILFAFKRKTFRYVENLWVGTDGKPSIRAVLGIAMSISFIRNMDYALHSDKSISDLAMILGIQAGLIAAFFTLTTYQNIQAKNAEASPAVTVQNADTVTGTKANTVNAEKVNTINSQNTNINQGD